VELLNYPARSAAGKRLRQPGPTNPASQGPVTETQ
jgi:hypothetical protein